MRSVLCFGDSNTYGQVPGEGPLDRFDSDSRWPCVMQKSLGAHWQVVEEGLSGRTTIFDDPVEGAFKNGKTYLRPCIQSHAPLDLIILMLGTNDLKIRFHNPPSEVAMGIGVLVHDIKDFFTSGGGEQLPEIMIVSPPPMLDDIKEWQPIFDGAPEKSRKLALEFERIADSLEVHFYDAGSVVKCSEVDGFHLDAHAHQTLGAALALEVESIGWTEHSARPSWSEPST